MTDSGCQCWLWLSVLGVVFTGVAHACFTGILSWSVVRDESGIVAMKENVPALPSHPPISTQQGRQTMKWVDS